VSVWRVESGAPRSWLSRGVQTPWLLLAVPAVVGLAAGATSNPVLVVAALLGLAYFWASLEYPVAALAVFVVLTFISQIAGVGAGTSVAKGAGGVLVISWLYRQFARRSATLDFDGSPGVRPFIVGSVSLFAWMVISTAWASDSHAAFASALRLVQGPLIALVIVATVDRLAAFRVVVICYVAGATASALAGMAGVTHSDSASVVASGRLGGGIGDPNFLAAVLVSALMIALFALQAARSRGARIVLGLAALTCLAAIFLTESRGGVIGLAVAIVVAIAYAGPVRRQMLITLAATAAFAVLYFSFAPPSSFQHLTTFTTDGGTGRSDLWTVAAKAVRQHPLVGVGAGNYTIEEPKYLVTFNQNLPRADLVLHHEGVHNTYLHLAAELGIVGAGLFLFTILVPIFYAGRVVRMFSPKSLRFEPIIGRGLVAGVFGMLAAFVFLSAQYEKQLWITLGLVLAFDRVGALSASQGSEEPKAPDL
jgi:O-antigen ligase